MKNEFDAWAIYTYSDEGHGYLGRYWFGNSLPRHLEGCRIALFKTRAIARAELPGVKQSWPKARVVGVRVSIAKTSVSASPALKGER